MPSRTTRSARGRTSLPLSISTSRSAATPPASAQSRRSRPSKQWRTRGVVDKQSTLTQIDFVRPLGRSLSEDEDLEYEEEAKEEKLELQDGIPDEPRRKRRKIDVLKDSDADRRKSAPVTKARSIHDEKENQAQQSLEDNHTIETMSKFQTPRKGYKREVCSSQSPVTPLSVRSTKRSAARVEFSPLKNLSTNIFRQPRLVVEDTYNTNDTTRSSLSRVASANSDVGVSRSPRTSRHEYSNPVNYAPITSTSKLEILDSDEEAFDPGTIRSLQSSSRSIRHEELPQQKFDTNQNADLTAQSVESEADICKPPVSDDSKDEIQESVSAEQTPTVPHIGQEVNTLDDRLVLKRMRTYSGSRRRSIMASIPSSSVDLEELPEIGPASPQSPTITARQVIEVPSSPPVYSANKELKADELQSTNPDADSGEARVHSSPTTRTDSQKATVQLQQESQWQAAVVPSSQASTASILLSSPSSKDGRSRRQAVSAKQGWFINPLTDSQLLPESIMNFELPQFPRMLRWRRHAGTGDEAVEEQ